MNTTNNGHGPVRVKFVMAVAVTMVFVNFVQATFRMEYQAVVTNVPDGNTVVISNRMLKGGGFYHKPLSIRLDGIESPGLINEGGEEARILLEKLALGKEVLVSELFDSGVSRGACLFVLNDSRRYAENDCINFMLVSNGMSRFTGYFRAFNFDSRETEKAQLQAQASHKGIWGLPAASPVLMPPICADSNVLDSVPQQAPINTVASEPINTSSAAKKLSVRLSRKQLIIPIIVGVGFFAFSVLLFWFRRRP